MSRYHGGGTGGPGRPATSSSRTRRARAIPRPFPVTAVFDSGRPAAAPPRGASRLLAERPRCGDQIVGVERREVLGPGGVEPLREPQRLRVQRLLEQRPREARVPEALAANRAV